MNNRIIKLLEYISKENDYYIKKSNGNFDLMNIFNYPILTRKELQQEKYNLLSRKFKSKYYYNNLKKQKSSGTSGIPITVLWDSSDYNLSIISLWRLRFKYYGIKPTDKCVSFTLNAFNISNQRNLYYIIENNVLHINMSLINNIELFEIIVDILNKFEPKWLYIQPSILEKLLQAYLNKGKKLPNSLIYIESVGEMLSNELKKRIKDVFNLNVTNLYGSEEMNGIAYECPFGIMHILTDNVYVECYENKSIKQSGTGEAIITNLHNKAMPLIRYNQGDIISLENEYKCKCGQCTPIIKKIKGRTLDIIKLQNNYELNSFTLLEIISEANNLLNNIIIEYKYTFFKSTNELLCRIKLDKDKKNWMETASNLITDLFFKKTLLMDSITFHVIELCDNFCFFQKRSIITIVD